MLMPGDVDWEVRQATPPLIYRDFNLRIVVVGRSLVIAIEPRGYVERGSGGDADMRPGACLRVSERLGLGQKRRRESGQALETYKDSIVFFYGENRTCDRDTVVDVGLA
jgi:hypothetical protein